MIRPVTGGRLQWSDVPADLNIRQQEGSHREGTLSHTVTSTSVNTEYGPFIPLYLFGLFPLYLTGCIGLFLSVFLAHTFTFSTGILTDFCSAFLNFIHFFFSFSFHLLSSKCSFCVDILEICRPSQNSLINELFIFFIAG